MKRTYLSLAILVLSFNCMAYAEKPCIYGINSSKPSGTTRLCPTSYRIDSNTTGSLLSASSAPYIDPDGILKNCSSSKGTKCSNGTYTECIGNKYSCYDGTWTLTKENEPLP